MQKSKQIPHPTQIDGVTIRRVEPGPDAVAASRLAAASMGGTPDIFAYYVSESAIASGEEIVFVGRVDGVDVSQSMCWVVDGCAGIYMVGTLESHRRRGLGRLLTEVAVHAGREAGCDVAYLQATAMGYSTYERLGFRTRGRVAVYRRDSRHA